MNEDVTKEWAEKRYRHPFFGECFSREKISEIWDRSAKSYDDGPLGPVQNMVIEEMRSSGILMPGFSIIDIGCGPGTYSFRFAELVEEVVCLDGSREMLNRLESKCLETKTSNIEHIHSDWTVYESARRFDVVFSSLCPPLNCPEQILRMESLSRRFCVYISSMNDDAGSVHMEIWKALGRDYTFNGYNTEYPYRFLISKGRAPVLKVFETSSPSEKSVEDVVRFEMEKFSAYMDTDNGTERIIKDVVEAHAEDGVVHYDGRKKLGLLIWAPLQHKRPD